MGKSIYKLLNEIEIDFTEYENQELSSVEKEACKQRILYEVRKMENKTKQKNKKGQKIKIAAGMAAACALAIGAFGAANPTLAKNIFGGVFEKLIDNAKGEKYEEEKTAIYSKIGENSVEAEAEVAKQEGGEDYTISAEDNGVTISVSDIYCDGYVLYYTASLKTDNEGLNQADGILIASKEAGSDKLEIEGMDMSGATSSAFQKSEDGLFVSAHEIDLLSEGGSSVRKTDENGTIVADWTITNLTGNLWDSWDAQGEYETTGIVDGNWHLRFPVTVDQSENETFEICKEQDGIMIKDAVKTKAGLVLHVHFPDFRQAPYNDPYNDPDIGIKDTEGNYLQWMSQRHEENADGTTDSWIMVLYSGEQELSLEVTAKDEEATEIANIAFSIEK